MHAESENDVISGAVAAALLGSVSRVLNGWSMVFALVALLILGMRPVGLFAGLGFAASVVAALIQMYFAVRTEFDAAVFAKLGSVPEHYARFDYVLYAWGIKNLGNATRSIDERVRGAALLCRRQAYCLAAQATLLGIALTAFVAG